MPQKQAKCDKIVYKNAILFVLCWLSTAGLGACPEEWWMSSLRLCWRTLVFPLKWVSITDTFLVNSRSLCPALGPAWLEAMQALCMLP